MLRGALAAGALICMVGCGSAPVATERPVTARGDAADIDRAVAEIARRVPVAVTVPADLPTGAKVLGRPSFYKGGAQLSLGWPHKQVLTIQYGHAGFDGCGPLHPREVKVGGAPGVLEIVKRGERPYAAIVWPATVGRPHGRYSLAGTFNAERLLTLARSMPRGGGRPTTANGC